MTFSEMLMLSLLVTPITDRELMRRPEAIQMRMSLLQPGMKDAEVKLVLGIGQRRPTSVCSINRYHSSSFQYNIVYYYNLGSQQSLDIVFQHEDKVLVSAKLYRRWPNVVARFP